MTKLKFLVFSSLIIMAALPATFGQACCSGGIPLAKNVGIRPVEEKQLNLRMHYEANILNSFYTGSEKLETATAKRLSQSVFFQGSYGLSPRFSVHSLFSWVHHKRSAINSPYAGESEKAMGFGDAVIMLQYQVFNRPKSASYLSLGIKVPTGINNLTNEQDIQLAPDLQPGTGSWDMILSGGLTGNWIKPGMNLNLNFTGKFNTYASRYDGQQLYKYGNEYQFSTGLSDSYLIGKVLINPGLDIRFWRTSQDRVDETDFPNTGGFWIYLHPSLGVNINQWSSLFTAIEIPVYQNLTGTQLTTSLRISAGLQILIPTKKNILIPIGSPLFTK